jgi:prepilin-type N-terminal cleavage/methylation domain-containing protein
MKITALPTNRARQMSGFTLIEMIGVLAVIAILAAVLIPKVFEAINKSRVSNAAMSCNTVKTAIADHYAKAGSLLVDASGATPVTLTAPLETYDQLPLLKEGFLDKPFATKIGDGTMGATGTRVRAFTAPAAAAVDESADTGFILDGTGANNEALGSVIVEAVITGATETDAKDLNDLIDGPSLGQPIGTTDLKGRVKYKTGSPTTIYIYLTHR